MKEGKSEVPSWVGSIYDVLSSALSAGVFWFVVLTLGFALFTGVVWALVSLVNYILHLVT